jgi:site-specific DNA recombinase
MERVAIYARVSTEGQAERQTIDSQLDACRAYCAERGYEVVEEFRDNGVSGAIPLDERPEGGRLLALAQEGLFTRVVIYTVDRLGRDTSEGIIAVRRLRRAKVAPEFVSQSFDDTAEGRFTFQVFLAVAELERGLIARRTTQGRRRKAREGGYVASITPYGYVHDPAAKTLREHPEQAAVVREVYRLAVEENLGLHAVATRLNDLGVPPPANASHPVHRSTHGWHVSMVYRILTNPRYCGRGTYAGEVMPCPPLVGEELFAAAGEALRRRKRVRSARTPDDPFVLRGVARCRLCGGACATGHVGRQRLPYYRCTRALRYGVKAHGGRAQWPAKVVEPPVQRWVLALLDDPDAALAQAQVYWERQDAARAEREERRQRLEQRVARSEEEEAKVTTWARKGYLDEAAMLRQVTEVRAERATALGELNGLRAADDDAAREAVNREVMLGAVNLMRRPEWRERHHVNELRELMLATDHARWQETVRQLVQTAWLEQDGSVTVEGLLPLDVATVTAFPRS